MYLCRFPRIPASHSQSQAPVRQRPTPPNHPARGFAVNVMRWGGEGKCELRGGDVNDA